LRGLKKLRPTVHPDIGIHRGLKFRMGTPNLSPQGKTMTESKTDGIRKPVDGLGYSRAFCEKVGKLEPLFRGEKIRLWYAGSYRIGRVSAPVPGGCYWVKLDVKIGAATRLLVTCANFGGRVND